MALNYPKRWLSRYFQITLNTGHHRIRLQSTTSQGLPRFRQAAGAYPLYIAIVALARYVILDMKAMDNWRMLAAAGAALVLAFTVLVIRYGHAHYPYGKDE
jgi:phosphoglycerol transferase MdoB-like AlkP superfamily enzyme